VHVCTHVCARVCTCVCARVCARVCACLCVCVHVCMHICVCVCIFYAHVCMCVCAYVCACVSMCMWVCMCAHLFLCACVHIDSYVYVCMSMCIWLCAAYVYVCSCQSWRSCCLHWVTRRCFWRVLPCWHSAHAFRYMISHAYEPQQHTMLALSTRLYLRLDASSEQDAVSHERVTYHTLRFIAHNTRTQKRSIRIRACSQNDAPTNIHIPHTNTHHHMYPELALAGHDNISIETMRWFQFGWPDVPMQMPIINRSDNATTTTHRSSTDGSIPAARKAGTYTKKRHQHRNGNVASPTPQ